MTLHTRSHLCSLLAVPLFLSLLGAARARVMILSPGSVCGLLWKAQF